MAEPPDISKGSIPTPRYSLRVKLGPNLERDSFNHKTKRSSKDFYNEYRMRLKQDQRRYEEYKRSDCLKSKSYRESLTGEKLKTYNEKTKLRMKAYRLRLKEKGAVEKPSTRQKITKLREYWRKKKQEERETLTVEQRQSINERRRAKYKEKSKKKLYFGQAKCQETPEKVRHSQYLPKKPKEFAETISKAMQNATPKRKNALIRKGLIFSKEEKIKHETDSKIVARVKKALKDLKTNPTKEGRRQYQLITQKLICKYAVEHQMRRALDIKWEYWLKMSHIDNDETLKRSDAFADEKVKCIETFYEYESQPLPTKKTVSIKSLKQKRVLTDTIQHVHRRFLQDHPHLKVSLSHFRKLRPKEVLTVKQQKFSTCLCEYCLNAQFKIDAINKAAKSHKIDLKIENKYHAVDITLCDIGPRDIHPRKCLERMCSGCGTEKIKAFLRPLIDVDDGKEYTWKLWKLGTVGTASKTVQRQILVEQNGDLCSLVDELLTSLGALALHLFNARWQYKQFNEISKNVPENVLVTLVDFAENYRCVHQDEIQSAYYSYNQATVFPMIAYYKCPDCKEATVQESAVFISSDLKHDSMAMNQFSQSMTQHLSSHVKYDKEIQFSDGCAAQFKSKLPFLFMSRTNTHKMERAYFGSRHGKSPCDALGGLIKKQAETYVKSRKGFIQSAKALYEFCNANLTIQSSKKCEHRKRVFFYHEEIKRTKLTQEVKPVKGTRQFHHYSGIEPGTVKSRLLSCFCNVCIGIEEGDCHNEVHVGTWKFHCLLKGRSGECSLEKLKKRKKAKPNTKQPLLVASKRLKPLPGYRTKTFCNTAKTVDKISLTLCPTDIPLETDKLHPALIYGDGNCLPRCASLLAFGSEESHKEMRDRIVQELIQNAEMYLDDDKMRKGMNSNGNQAVTRTFASYSNCYQGTRLNTESIRKVYNQEILSIKNEGYYMGLWQLASLANILSRPVVSVYPQYGSNTVRADMHRVFYPFKEEYCDEEPVHVMWTNINGRIMPESHFSVNHFVVLMPFTTTDINTDTSTDMQDIIDIENTSFSEDFWTVIQDFDNQLLTTEQQTPKMTEHQAPTMAEHQPPTMTELQAHTLIEQQATTMTKQQIPTMAKQQAPTMVEQQAPTMTEQQVPTTTEQQVHTMAEQKTPTMIEQQANTTTEQQAKTMTEQQAPTMTEHQTPTSTEQQTPTTAEQQIPTMAKQQAPTMAEQQAPTMTEQQVHTMAEQKTPTMIEQQANTTTEQQAKTMTEQQAPTTTEHQTPTSTEQQTPTTAEQQIPTMSKQQTPTMAEQQAPTMTAQQVHTMAEQKTPTMIEQQANTTTEQQAKTMTEQQAPTTTEHQNPTSTEQQTPTTAEQKAQTMTEQQAQTTTEHQTSTTVEQQNPTTTEQQTLTMTEHEAHTTTEHQTPTSAKQQTPTTTEHQTPTMTEQQTPTTTEQQTTTMTENQAHTTTEQQAPTMTEQQAPTKTEHQTPTTTEQKAPTMTEQQAPTTSEQPAPMLMDQTTPYHTGIEQRTEKDTTTSAGIQVGDFILCEYATQRRRVQYVGEVLDLNSGDFLPYVEFLENLGTKCIKRRSRYPECCLVDFENVIKVLNKPETLVKGSQVLLSFKDIA